MIIEAVGFDHFRVGCFELTADARSKALEEILHETIVSNLSARPGTWNEYVCRDEGFFRAVQ